MSIIQSIYSTPNILLIIQLIIQECFCNIYLEIGVVPISCSFFVSKLASCQIHAHFLSRNWRRANFMLIFYLEIGAVPNSCSFSALKLAPCQFHAHFPLRNCRHAKFMLIFRLEIGAVPTSLSYHMPR